MDKAIQVSRRFLYLSPQIVVRLQIKDICHEVESMLIVLNLYIQAGQVKPVRKVLFVDFAKVFIALR